MALDVLLKATDASSFLVNIPEHSNRIISAAITVIETVLGWDFLDESIDTVGSLTQANFSAKSTSDTDSYRNFPVSWSDLMLTPDFLDLFFKVYIVTSYFHHLLKVKI
jgi:hypothetical protein